MRFVLLPILLIYSFTFANAFSTKVNQALYALEQGNPNNAFILLKQAASTNNLLSQYLLAQCYEFGIGTDINTANAFSMYRKAAERGFSPAMKDLAECYRRGLGVQIDLDKATYWSQRFHSKPTIMEIPDILAIYNASNKMIFQSNDSLVDNRVEVKVPQYTDNSSHSNPSAINFIRNPINVENDVKDIQISDVDINIPQVSMNNEMVFALIIANENYQDVSSVGNAYNDGEVFSQYCNKILGIPQINIHFIKDATLNNLKREINLIKKIAEAYNGEAIFVIYYAGHGIPDEKTKNAFLMPVDGFTADLSTCYCLNDLYETLGKIPSKKVVVFLDACFSGSLRGNGMLTSARGIAIKPKSDTPKGNTIVISSAQGDETAYSYDEQNHGLFTYFLLKKLKESKGNVTLGELIDFVKDNVVKKSIIINGKSQTPTATPSPTIVNDWYNWKLF